MDTQTTKLHYHYGAGLHGYLYQDGPYYSQTLQEAVDALADSYGLGRTRKATLKRNHSLELNLDRDGNEYCEIQECSDNCSAEDYE